MQGRQFHKRAFKTNPNALPLESCFFLATEKNTYLMKIKGAEHKENVPISSLNTLKQFGLEKKNPAGLANPAVLTTAGHRTALSRPRKKENLANW